jgi:hypothetical protein
VTEVFAELGDFASGLILDDDAVAGGSGIAAGTTVDVRAEVMLGGIFAGVIFTGREE